MQKAANGHQEIERGFEFRPQPGRQKLGFLRPVAFFFHRREERKPVREVVIAQPAGPVLHVGLQVKDGVAKLVVAAAREVRQALNDGSRLACHDLGNHVVVQSRKEAPVARKIPAVEQRNCELHVVRIELFAFGERPGGRAELQPEIPDFLRKAAKRVFQVALGPAPGVEKKNVDIRMGKEPAASEAAERNEGEIARAFGVRRDEFVPQAERNGLDQLGAAVDGGAAVTFRGKFLLQAR